jgi:hypothetical protein
MNETSGTSLEERTRGVRETAAIIVAERGEQRKKVFVGDEQALGPIAVPNGGGRGTPEAA